ncbi:MAG: DUF2809 domain-containing protein [Sarcina sp.]
MELKLNHKYLIAFIVLLSVEVFIALFVKDNFIRPYVGDILVVVVLYVFIKSFISKVKNLPIYIFLFAFFIEILQYFDIIKILGVQNNKFISTLIGSTFDIKDIICYFIGDIIIIVYEKILTKRSDVKI